MEHEQRVYEAMQATGLPEYYLRTTHPELWTWEAFNLFQEAQAAGIICFEGAFTDTWRPGPGKPLESLQADLNSDSYTPPSPITKGQLAYFCKRASKRLHLNKGCHTNWAPFEFTFDYKPKTMRRYLHNVEERGQATRLEDPYIDAFFDKSKPYK